MDSREEEIPWFPPLPPWIKVIYVALGVIAAILSIYGFILKYLNAGWSAALLLFIVVVALGIIYLKEHYERKKLARQAYQTFSMIVRLSDLLARKPKHTWDEIEETYDIDNEGNCECSRHCILVAIDDIYTLKLSLGASPDSSGMGSVTDKKMKLDVRDVSGARIPFFITRDDLRQKELTLFFFPPMNPGDRRNFYVTYKWFGLWKSLIENRSDTSSANLLSPAKLFRIKILLPPNVAEVDAQGASANGQRMTLSPTIQDNRVVVDWVVENPVTGRYTLFLNVTKIRA